MEQELVNEVNELLAQKAAAPVPSEENTTEEATEVVTETTVEATDDFVFGGDPITPEVNATDLQKRLEQLERENNELKERNPFADERVAKINEYVRNGGEINETFWKLQSKNYSDLKSEDQLLSALKDKYTLVDGFTEVEAQRLIAKNYPNLIDRDNADPDELTDEVISLKASSKTFLKELSELQSKVLLPNVSKAQLEQRAAQVEAYRTYASVKVNEIKGFEVPLMDNYTMRINIDKANHDLVKDLVVNPEKQEQFFLDNYSNEKGEIDIKKFAEDEYFRRNRVPLLRAALAKGIELGKKQAVSTELLNEKPNSDKQRAQVSQVDATANHNLQTFQNF